jgi:hypothetical protein
MEFLMIWEAGLFQISIGGVDRMLPAFLLIQSLQQRCTSPFSVR